jgi:hypothetical protein
MEKIPTAEEFLEDNLSNPTKGWSEKKRLIEFAKLHVEAALKSADLRAENEIPEGFWEDVDDKDFIINSYPLDNIK